MRRPTPVYRLLHARASPASATAVAAASRATFAANLTIAGSTSSAAANPSRSVAHDYVPGAREPNLTADAARGCVVLHARHKPSEHDTEIWVVRLILFAQPIRARRNQAVRAGARRQVQGRLAHLLCGSAASNAHTLAAFSAALAAATLAAADLTADLPATFCAAAAATVAASTATVVALSAATAPRQPSATLATQAAVVSKTIHTAIAAIAASTASTAVVAATTGPHHRLRGLLSSVRRGH